MPEKVAFILSTGRTGTRALAEGLAGTTIASPHQPPFSRPLTILSNFYFNGILPKSCIDRLVCATRLRQVTRATQEHYIQVFSLDHMPARIVTDHLPETRIVHIVRDPRTFVPSYLNWSHSQFKSIIANRFVPGWHPSGHLAGGMPLSKWLRMSELERVCWHWSFKNHNIESLFANHPHYLRLRFEDLFLGGDQESYLHSLLFFLDIGFEDRFNCIWKARKNESKPTAFPRWNNWTDEQQRQLMAICATQMDHYGYPTDAES